MKTLTPFGVRDYLPQEAKELDKKTGIIEAVFKKNNYNKVITPSLEFFSSINSAFGPNLQEKCITFFGPAAELLVLRPDPTAAVARIISGRFKNNPLPIKVYYLDSVFRKDASERGIEFLQAGSELIGAKGPKADAEIIILCIETLLGLGIKDFGIDLGHQSFIENLSQEKWTALIKKDYVTYGKIPERGSVEIIKGNDYLLELYEILKKNKMQAYVSFNKGLVKDISYYTGIIFDCYIKGFGKIIGSGGRYDNLLAKFGFDCPAVGFALNVNHINNVLGIRQNTPRPSGTPLERGEG